MKRFFILLVLALPLACYSQTSQEFELSGAIGHAQPAAKVFLFYTLGANQVADSCAVTNGTFTFKGVTFGPAPALLAYDHTGGGLGKIDRDRADVLPVYLEKGLIHISTADSISRAKITGSLLNDENQVLMAQLNSIKEKARQLNVAAAKTPAADQQSAAFQNNMQLQFKKLQIEQEHALKEFVSAHPKSYISLLAISSLGGPNADPQLLDALYNVLDPSLTNLEAGKQVKLSIDRLKITAIGSIAPDFTQPDVNGTPVKLSSFRGKYVLIDFWASWCGPCRQENPNVVQAYHKYKDKNFTILGVSLDRPGAKAAWENAIKTDRLDWTQVSDLKFWENEAARLYFVSSIPQNFLIDPQGKIIAKNLRGEELSAKLQQVLAN